MEPDRWDRELSARFSPAALLQSWGWGEVQARAGWLVQRLWLPSGGMATVLLRGMGPLRWGYVPRGPTPADSNSVRDLVDWAWQHRLASIKIEPEAPTEFAATMRRLGLLPAASLQPINTAIVSLAGETELLASFAKETRYCIRRAGRVVVDEGSDVEQLARLTSATASRQAINLPGPGYDQILIDQLRWCRTYVARHDDEALAANLVAHFDGRAYYLYAGWSGTRSDLMPSYGALWASMRAALRDGRHDFDLWGVPPNEDATHAWYGLGLFKRGFHGTRNDYCGAWELILSPLPHEIRRLSDRVRLRVRRFRGLRQRT